jgi:hypothetical protein
MSGCGTGPMYTKQAGVLRALRYVDWDALGNAILTPEVLGAIIGGTGAPLITYLVRRKKEMPAWQRVAELLGAGVLGAGAGAGIGYGGKHLARMVYDVLAPYPPTLSNRRSLERYVKDWQRALDTARGPLVGLPEINKHYHMLLSLRDNTAAILNQLKQAKSQEELDNLQFLADRINEMISKDIGKNWPVEGPTSLERALRLLAAYADYNSQFIQNQSTYRGMGREYIERKTDENLQHIFKRWGLE